MSKDTITSGGSQPKYSEDFKKGYQDALQDMVLERGFNGNLLYPGLQTELDNFHKKYSGENAIQGLTVGTIEAQIRFLQGEVLTLIEAVVDDKERREATKDIIKSSFNRKMNWIMEISYGTKVIGVPYTGIREGIEPIE